ncbi:MAG: hypothetical protein WC796_04290 [Candidatus Pacearchaeota archaeon]|jgi:hypothetical protein
MNRHVLPLSASANSAPIGERYNFPLNLLEKLQDSKARVVVESENPYPVYSYKPSKFEM